MDALEALSRRRSIRKFRPGNVTREQLSQIVNAGRIAPTARNEQPCQFVVVTDRAKLRQLAHLAEYGKFIADAAACIVIVARPVTYYLEDGCAAATQMLIAATALGLGSCWVAGDKKAYAPQIVALCGAPAEYKLVALLAIGHAGEHPAPEKRALADVLHWDTFAR